MSYFAICSFDLKDGSREDYQNAYADLARLGFSTRVTGNGGSQITLPTTTTAGSFDGSSAATIRDDLRAKVAAAFRARNLTSEIFVSVGGQDWTWGHQKT